MTKDIERARFEWRCRRGMLELDLLLNRFMEQGYAKLTFDQKDVFQRILEEPDPDLYAWLMGYEIPTVSEYKIFIDWFREHFSNAHKNL